MLTSNKPSNTDMCARHSVPWQAWTLKVEWIDTKEGVVTHIELVVGAPPKGWDPLHPTYGNLFAGFWNDALVGPMLGRVRNSPDWEGSFAAISRHMVEEHCTTPTT
jgi:hypothetical protein